MKHILILTLSILVLAACNSGSDNKVQTNGATTDHTADPVYQKGLELVANNRCMTCHAIDATVTGPAYREVAKKYANSPDTIVSHLAGKIISGGNGVWGQILMTPHPDLTKEDAEAMVRYILLLNKK
jgi:cytochrome c